MIGITKSEFENSLFRQDVVEYYLAMSKEELEYKFGNIISDMKDYDQHNPHQCYTLFEHVLRTVLDIPTGELSQEEVKLLKIAAFLHDVAKPKVARVENGKVEYDYNNIQSAKMAREFLQELGFEEFEIQKITFYIEHINDFLYYKDEVPYYYEHHIIVKKISARTIAEKFIENEYDFNKLKLNNYQTKSVCYALLRKDEWPLFEDEKGNEIKVEPVDLENIKCRLIEVKKEYSPTLKDYKMLLKLSISNYKAQAKRSYLKGKLIATRSEKVRVSAIIESMLPDAYKLYKNTVSKFQADGALTQELIDATEEYNELLAMNQIEQMREDNAKNLMNKFNDMKIRLTMKQ